MAKKQDTPAKTTATKDAEAEAQPNSKAAILKGQRESVSVVDDTEPTTPTASTGKDAILKAASKTLEDAAPFNFHIHQKRQDVAGQGTWCFLGQPFDSFLVKLLPLSHGKVQTAINHQTTVSRRKHGLKEGDPNTVEVVQEINAAAVLAGCRALQGTTRFAEGEEPHQWENPEVEKGRLAHLNEEDKTLFSYMLANSRELAQRAIGIMRDLGKPSDERFLKLHEDGEIFGRDLIVNSDTDLNA